VFCEFRGGVEIPLAKRRAPAAAPFFCERDFESEDFEKFYRSDADVRFVVAYKCVVSEDDAASAVAGGGDPGSSTLCRSSGEAGINDPGYSMLREPIIEALLRVMRQRALCGDAKSFLHSDAYGFGIEKPIR